MTICEACLLIQQIFIKGLLYAKAICQGLGVISIIRIALQSQGVY